MVDVLEVELDPIGPWDLVPPLELRPARNAGADREPPQLLLVVALDLVGERGPGADDAHLAANDVQELGDLVE